LGDWGLGIGPNPQSPIPNPQSPIPNPHLEINLNLNLDYQNFFFIKNLIYIFKLLIYMKENKLDNNTSNKTSQNNNVNNTTNSNLSLNIDEPFKSKKKSKCDKFTNQFYGIISKIKKK